MTNPNSTGSDDRDFQTRYAHMIEVLVNEGDIVSRGKILGYIGSTGQSSAEHLHFETCVGPYRVPVDPTQYYAGTQYCNGCDNYLMKLNYNYDNIISDKRSINVDVFDYNQDGNNIYFYINNEYILDLDSIIEMTIDDMEKYGITQDAIETMIRTITEENLQNQVKTHLDALSKVSKDL